MLGIFKNVSYARLFMAQIIALLGTGLLTIALGLLAYELAGDEAGVVLGTAFAIKMIAYVGLAPLVNAVAHNMPRKVVLVGADIIRAVVALALPFVDALWQIYLLIFVLQAASASFTPVFQAVIPDILEDEKDYTKALSLSRLAYDLENILSPLFAGLLLLFVSFHWLFVGTSIGFFASTLLVVLASIPEIKVVKSDRPFFERLTRGSRIYLATPRLRGLLLLNMAAASVGAFVLVNTVVMVRSGYGGDEASLAYAMAAFGSGSMLAALALPNLLERINERTIMINAAIVLAMLTIGHALYLLVDGLVGWAAFLFGWVLSGMLYSAILTPSGRLLRRSAHAEDRPAIFAAQFALSHACWLFTYPFAGWIGDLAGLPVVMLVLGFIALVATAVAMRIWPSADQRELMHEHPELPADHPHLKEGHRRGRWHSHVFIIDDEHRAWPTHG